MTDLQTLLRDDLFRNGFVSIRNLIPEITVRNIANNATVSFTDIYKNRVSDFRNYGITLPFVWELKTHTNVLKLFKLIYNIGDSEELVSSLERFEFIAPKKSCGKSNVTSLYHWRFVDFKNTNNPGFCIGLYNVYNAINFSYIENSHCCFDVLRDNLIGVRDTSNILRNKSDCTKAYHKVKTQCLYDLIEASNKVNDIKMSVKSLTLLQGDIIIMDPRLLISYSFAESISTDPLLLITLAYHEKAQISEKVTRRLFHTFITGGRTQCNLAPMSNTGFQFRKYYMSVPYEKIPELSTVCSNSDSKNFIKNLHISPISIFTNDLTRAIVLPTLMYGKNGLALYLLGARESDRELLIHILTESTSLPSHCLSKRFIKAYTCLEISTVLQSNTSQHNDGSGRKLLFSIVKKWIERKNTPTKRWRLDAVTRYTKTTNKPKMSVLGNNIICEFCGWHNICTFGKDVELDTSII